MFADDTTIYTSGNHIDSLIVDFKRNVDEFICWCAYNRMDINWSKTKIMFIIRNNNITIPKSIEIHNQHVEVVKQFRLLGVELDQNLKFSFFVADICKKVNRRIFAVKRLFFITHKVKIQFFKTFILPYFDYCTTLLIYFNKAMIYKLFKCYYVCLFRLFKYNFFGKDLISINQVLQRFGLTTIQYRIFTRIALFINKLSKL
jgi:hypothetical protein